MGVMALKRKKSHSGYVFNEKRKPK